MRYFEISELESQVRWRVSSLRDGGNKFRKTTDEIAPPAWMSITVGDGAERGAWGKLKYAQRLKEIGK